jgi:hypothetical protein
VLIVGEYPKSGGNWIVNVIARTIGWQRADLYDLRPEPRPIDPRHPWYVADAPDVPLRRPDETVVKSHELPFSELLPPDAPVLHLVRNPLDVAVSRWFYVQDFLPKNDLGEPVQLSMAEHVAATVEEWARFVAGWCGHDTPLVTYESMQAGRHELLAASLARVGHQVEVSALAASFAAETPAATRRSLGDLFEHNTFVRKATVGDWRNHLDPAQAPRLLELARPGLDALGRTGDPAAVGPTLDAVDLAA